MHTPGVDFGKTKTNHIIEMYETLGIEAARRTIIEEVKFIMERHGMQVDIRHITLLADVMTFKGSVLGINRHGVAKMKNSTLMLASFEQTTDHLYDAAVYSKKDTLAGVSESIITGNMAPLGTGAFKICFDDEAKAQPAVEKKEGSVIDKYISAQCSTEQPALLFDSVF